MSVDGDLVRFRWRGQAEYDAAVEDITWSLDDAGLHIELVAAENVESFDDNAAGYAGKPWVRIAD